MSLIDAQAWLEGQVAPLYRPTAGSSITPDDIGGRPPIETDQTLEGDFTPPTGSTSSPQQIQVTSPDPADLHPAQPIYAGTIEGTVADCLPGAIATPIYNVSSTLDVPSNQRTWQGDALGVVAGGTHRVQAYQYVNGTYNLRAGNVAVNSSGHWSFNQSDDPGDWRFRLIEISTGDQIGAEWSNATKDWYATDKRIMAFLYADVYYSMQSPAIATERQWTDVLIDPADMTIFGVAVSGAGPYTIAGDTHITTAGTHQIRATHSSVLEGYFNVAADGTWSLVHADNDLDNWLFELVELAGGTNVGDPWTTTQTYSGKWWVYALGFPGTWRFRLEEYGGAHAEIGREWQSVNGNDDTYDDLDIFFCYVTDRDYLINMQVAAVNDRWWWSPPSNLRKSIRLQLVSDSHDPLLELDPPQAEWSMSNGLPRSFNYLPGDPQYGERGEHVSFLYDAALTVMAFLSVSEWALALEVALGMVSVQFADGPFPFAAFQRYTQLTYDRVLRTGAIAWVAYALLKCKQMLPPAYQDPRIDNAALLCLAWMETMIDATGMVQGGEGEPADAWLPATVYAVDDVVVNNDNVYVCVDPGTSAGSGGPTGTGAGIVDNGVIWDWVTAGSINPVPVTFHSTEHNVDAWAAFNLAYRLFGVINYRERAKNIKQGLLDYHWDAANGRFYQGSDINGVPDGVSSLDSGSWGGIMLINWGEMDKATSAITRLDAHYLVTYSGSDGYRMFSEDDGVAGYTNYWHEGTFGVALAYRRLGDNAKYASIVADAVALQEPDGGFKYVYGAVLDPGVLDRESISGPAWYIMAAHPEVTWAETIATPLASRKFVHAEVWTDLECAGGTMLAILNKIISLTVHRAVVYEQRISLVIDRTSPGALDIDLGRVLTLRYDDGSAEEWRATQVSQEETKDGVLETWTAVHPVMDLAELPFLREVNHGVPNYSFGAVDLTPLQYVTNFILPQCPSYVQLGLFDSDVLLSLEFNRVTPYGGVGKIVEAANNLRIPLEFDYVRVGGSGYAIHIITQVGQEATPIELRVGKHITQLTATGDATDQTTLVQSFGADSGTMAHAAWLARILSGTEIEIRDSEQDAAFAILQDDQLNGKFIVRPDNGDLIEVLDSRADDQVIVIADTSPFNDDDFIEFRDDAAGTYMDKLAYPGVREKFGSMEDTSLEGTRNLAPNGFQSRWSGTVNDPPDGYDFLYTASPYTPGAPAASITREIGPPFPDYGENIAHIVSVGTWSAHLNANGYLTDLTPWIDVQPNSRFTMSVRLQINSMHSFTIPGDPTFTQVPTRLRLQLERDGATDPEFFPVSVVTTDSQTVAGGWIDLVAENIILPMSGRYYIRLHEYYGPSLQNVYGILDIHVNAFQLTDTVTQRPWVEDSAATRLWHMANYQLSRAYLPTRQYSATVIDFARLDPVEYEHLRLARGGVARVISENTALDIESRLLEIDEDVIRSALVSVTLATQSTALTQFLAASIAGDL